MVEKYIQFFTTALKNQPFEKVYIDAFAGSGAFRYVGDEPPNALFPRDPAEHIHAGSAARALRCEPPFDRLYFFESRRLNVRALERLITDSAHPAAIVEHGDANEGIRKLSRKEFWRNKRGVIFLDPFGMSVAWSTLKLIAETHALDVWLLFPLSGLVRNLALSADRLDDGKRRAITRLLGTDDWFERFYKAPPAPPMRPFQR